MAVNPVTGPNDVAKNSGASLTVISGISENAVATITVGTNPSCNRRQSRNEYDLCGQQR